MSSHSTLNLYPLILWKLIDLSFHGGVTTHNRVPDLKFCSSHDETALFHEDVEMGLGSNIFSLSPAASHRYLFY